MATAYFNQSDVKGTVEWEKLENGVLVTIQLHGMESNHSHAIHIHEFGDLSGGCMTSGGHWNPTNEAHGSYAFPERGRHMGDLINNIIPDSQGKVNIQFLEIGYNPEDIWGRTLVIHSLDDDLGLGGLFLQDGTFQPYSEMSKKKLVKLSKERNYPTSGTKVKLSQKLIAESKKTGNAGGRMACAVIGMKKIER